MDRGDGLRPLFSKSTQFVRVFAIILRYRESSLSLADGAAQIARAALGVPSLSNYRPEFLNSPGIQLAVGPHLSGRMAGRTKDSEVLDGCSFTLTAS